MKSVFTQFIATLDEHSYPSSELLDALRALLRGEMRRRGLFGLPPSTLGLVEATWPTAFDDLLMDCYKFAIRDRLRGLRGQLKVHENIDGLVRLNVRHFLRERQRGYDPVGYAVFKNLQGAVLMAAQAGILSTVGSRPGKINNDTVLRFGSCNTSASDSAEQLENALHECDEWHRSLPLLARINLEAQQLLLACLGRLGAVGIQRCRCRDLANIAKRAVRTAGYGTPRVRHQDQSALERVPAAQPASLWEGLHDLASLQARIRDGISKLPRQRRVRQRIIKVFDELVHFAAAVDHESPLSQAELSRRLGIPTSTLNDDMEILREMASEAEGKSG